MKNVNPDSAQTEFDFSEDNFRDENDEIDYRKVRRLFIRDFNGLQPIFSFDSLELRDISKMPKDKKYYELFNANFNEWFEDRIENLSADWEVKGTLENEYNYFTWFKNKNAITDYLLQNISDTEEDYDLSENELIKKHSKIVQSMLNDFENIFNTYAANYLFHFESDLTKSFIASAMVSLYRLDWQEWVELQELTK